jgi:outer membrane receptor protein involved in Fe transport
VGGRSTAFASDETMTMQVKLPSYNTFGARLGIDNEKYRATLHLKNLGDSRGITDYASSGAPNLNGSIAVIQPRTIGVTLSAKF